MDQATTQVNGPDKSGETGSRSSWIKRSLGYLFALAGLIWVFHDVHPQRLLSTIHINNWSLLGLAVFFDVLTYVLQGVRWKLLLSPIGRIRSIKATQAIYVGLFTNEVVPLRFGELVRAFLASRWLKAGIGAVVPSMVVERFLDALWLVAGIGCVTMIVPLPTNLVRAGDVLGALVLIATAVFVWLVFRKEQEFEHGKNVEVNGPRGSKIAAAVLGFAAKVATGLGRIGLSRNFYLATVLSAAMLACQGLAVWFIMLACGMKLGILAGASVLLIVRLGTAIPNAPANVGSFQFFTVLALSLFGVDKTLAAAFSIVDFAVLTVPLWAIGLFSLAATGMSFGAIRSEVTAARRNPQSVLST